MRTRVALGVLIGGVATVICGVALAADDRVATSGTVTESPADAFWKWCRKEPDQQLRDRCIGAAFMMKTVDLDKARFAKKEPEKAR